MTRKAKSLLADFNDPVVQAHVAAEIAKLQAMSLPALKLRWTEAYGCPVPGQLGKLFLVRALAWKLQVDLFGDVSKAVRNDLKVALHGAGEERAGGKVSGAGPQPASGRLVPGTRIVREWRGTTYIVELKADGLWWQETCYRSLSAVAKAITGTHWNGLLFFGLRERREQTARRAAKAAPAAASKPAAPVRRTARG